MALSTLQIQTLIKASAQSIGLPTSICLAIAEQESSFIPEAMRYEPKWRYLLNESSFASSLKITVETERQLQKFSYGLYQVMGSVARELGFSDMLPLLLEPHINIAIGLKKLKALSIKHKDVDLYISAYNAGSGGIGTNPSYVKSVLDKAKKYQSQI
jgi:soluble lytic murein transglycosylase-like protein